MDDRVGTSILKAQKTRPGLAWIAFLAVAVVLVGAALAYLWRQAALYPSTDDAYLGAHVIDIGAAVAGRVAEVAVAENSQVKAGAVLFKLDPRPFDYAVGAAQANLDQTLQSVGSVGATIDGAQALVAQRQTALNNELAQTQRTRNLFKNGNATKAQLDAAETSLAMAQANLTGAQADLTRLETELGKRNADNPHVRAATAALKVAEYNKEQSVVTAPANGYVTAFTLRPGSLVRENQTLFHLVETNHWWVDANLRETDLAHIKPCDTARVKIDMYPGVTLTGKVEGISAGSGAAFSLFPPENATGNWVKVTQRFPVRIALDHPPTNGEPLRVGASAWARIDTTSCK